LETPEIMRRAWPIVTILVILALLSVTWVGNDRLAVRESYGGAAMVLGPGVHLRVPLYHRLYRYDTRAVVLDEPLEVVTRDNASFTLPIRIAARVSPGDLLTFHEGRSGRESAVYIRETVRTAIRDMAKTQNADELLLPQAAGLLAQSVSAELITRGISDDGLEVEPPAPQVVFNAVVDYLSRKFPDSARRLAEAALKSDAKNALFHAAMGVVLESENLTEEAEKRYLEALYLDPAAAEPMSRLYVLYQARGDRASLERLARLLAASIASAPESSVHQDWLGQVYMRLGQEDKAEIAFNRAIELAPEAPQFRISLGSLRAGQSRFDEARAAFEEALKLQPDQPLALYNLGTTYAIEGRIDRAIEYFHRAERSGPPSHALFNALAQAYEQNGEERRAVEYLRRSLALRPDQPGRKAALERLESKLKKKG
jgi:tetratricopeptide (TPR) repeat protein